MPGRRWLLWAGAAGALLLGAEDARLAGLSERAVRRHARSRAEITLVGFWGARGLFNTFRRYQVPALAAALGAAASAGAFALSGAAPDRIVRRTEISGC